MQVNIASSQGVGSVAYAKANRGRLDERTRLQGMALVCFPWKEQQVVEEPSLRVPQVQEPKIVQYRSSYKKFRR